MAFDLPCYRVFGLHLESDFRFATPLLRVSSPPARDRINFTCSGDPPTALEPGSFSGDEATPIYQSPDLTARGETVFTLYRSSRALLLVFTDLAWFYLGEGWIHCEANDPNDRDQVEMLLFGPVLSFWLERSGVIALHGAAIESAGRAWGFLGQNGVGKSSLTAEVLGAGAALLDDDVLPIEEVARGSAAGGFEVRPGFPQMRMWPDLAERAGERPEDLPLILPGVEKRRVAILGRWPFQAEPSPLAGLFLLERGGAGTGVHLRATTPSEALIELVRHSFVPRLVSATGLERRRLDVLARLVQKVPVIRLVIAEGVDQVQLAAQRVLAHSAELG